jgi:hypothetical protein
MMLRLVGKELRENGIWALVAFAAAMYVIFLRRAPDLLGPYASMAAPWGGIYGSLGLSYGPGRIVLPLLWPTGMTLLLCMVWGAALGLTQTIVERARGTFQVLVTLPVCRDQVLVAKVAAGFILYTLSMGVPFGLLVWRAATPGHYPSPFRAWMLLPGLTALAGGLLTYAASLVTVLRPARWYATCGAPLVAGVGLTVLLRYYGWRGFAGLLLGAAVMLWAAAACMRDRDF